MSAGDGPDGTGRPLGLGDAGRAAGYEAAVEDVDGELLAPYAPGNTYLAADYPSYSELVVLQPDGTPLCLAVPIFERELGVLIAVPARHAGCLPGPHVAARVPAAADDDPSDAAPEIELDVDLIDVSAESFDRLAVASPDDPPLEWRFSADGDLPFSLALVAAADDWTNGVGAGPALAIGRRDTRPLPIGAGPEAYVTGDEGSRGLTFGAAAPVAARARGRGRGSPGPAGPIAGAAALRGRQTVAGVSEDVRLLADRLAGLEALLRGGGVAAASSVVPSLP